MKLFGEGSILTFQDPNEDMVLWYASCPLTHELRARNLAMNYYLLGHSHNFYLSKVDCSAKMKAPTALLNMGRNRRWLIYSQIMNSLHKYFLDLGLL